MHIVVFGATGKTGQLVLQQALERGHQVTAYVRDKQRLPEADRKIRVVVGRVDDEGAIFRAIDGADVVISALGSGRGTLTSFAKTAIPVLERRGPRRFISLVGAGVAEPGDPSSFGRTVMLGLMKLLAASVLQDASDHADLVRRSSLDWTLVRPPRLMDAPQPGTLGMPTACNLAHRARSPALTLLLSC